MSPMPPTPPSLPLSGWVLFIVVVLTLLAIDLARAARQPQAPSVKSALGGCAFWVALALAFNAFVYVWRGPEAAWQFFAGYLIEESLSVDNLFVFVMIFSYFRVPPDCQRRVLFLGILGAIFMRMIFIVVGVALVARFHWIIYLFGVFLVYTGYKMATEQDKEIEPDKNPVLKLVRKWIPVTTQYEGGRFFVRQNGRWHATPLFVVLVAVETTDVIFAVDSIPAVMAISSDAFIIFTSNVFAVLGLRALYFALSGMMGLFHHLHYGLAVILAFVGIKMLLSGIYPIPIAITLGVVVATLALSILASLWRPAHGQKPPMPPV